MGVPRRRAAGGAWSPNGFIINNIIVWMYQDEQICKLVDGRMCATTVATLLQLYRVLYTCTVPPRTRERIRTCPYVERGSRCGRVMVLVASSMHGAVACDAFMTLA
jgi:hypothetical protein